jgi:hypothetical protein
MGEGNGGNDDRGLKARNRKWGKAPKEYYTNRRNRPNSEATAITLRAMVHLARFPAARLTRIRPTARPAGYGPSRSFPSGSIVEDLQTALANSI